MIRFSEACRVKHATYGEGTVISYGTDYVMVEFDDRSDALELQGEDMNDLVVLEERSRAVERIIVKGLFGSMDYDIAIDRNNDISILIAPNGCGKTTIFKLLNFMLYPTIDKYQEICDVPFDSFTCVLNTKTELKLVKEVVDGKNSTYGTRDVTVLDYIIKNDGKEFTAAQLVEYDTVLKGSLLKKMYKLDDGTEKKNLFYMRKLYSLRCKEVMHKMDALKNKSGELDQVYFELQAELEALKAKLIDVDEMISSLEYNENSSVERFVEKIWEALNEADASVNVIFIGADRLAFKDDIPYDSPVDPHGAKYKDYLAYMSAVVSATVRNSIEEYNAKMGKARNELPRMYLRHNADECLSFSEFVNKWNKYEDNIRFFKSLGFLSDTEKSPIDMREIEDAYEEKKIFLNVYLEAFQDTLMPFFRIYKEAQMLAEIFNKRNEITNKKLLFTARGLIVVSDDKEIPIECLSSGEKHDLVMFFNLIFNTKNESVVLIDEPEISLHIEWQEEFINQLMKICEHNNLQAIVATHSPNIINGHFDLLAEKR